MRHDLQDQMAGNARLRELAEVGVASPTERRATAAHLCRRPMVSAAWTFSGRISIFRPSDSNQECSEPKQAMRTQSGRTRQ